MSKVRYGRTNFWLALVIVALLYFALSSIEARPMPWAMLLGAAIGGIFPFRLHDLGASGWWATIPALGAIGASIASFSDFPILAAFSGAIVAVAAIALAILPGQARTNRFGPPPEPLFGLLRSRL